jgi:carbamoyl-phosphate synthase large subunit
MPIKKHIKKVLVIGSGPIVIGQAAEFDYSGSQAITSLKEEGVEVVLINSNPATIMTDPGLADKVYIEPLTFEFVMKIISKEKPDGILATLGGQTALNLALQVAASGILEREKIELLGVNLETLKKAEDRQLFKELMHKIGEPVPESETVSTVEDGYAFADKIGFPLIIRPAFTLGGTGGGIAHNKMEFEKILSMGLSHSPIKQCLIERSIAGFKEIEFEIIRDQNDNIISVCSMENFDPVGIHTGDSIVFAPALTLTDKEIQMLRSASFKIIRSLKIEGACNVQLAIDQYSSQYYVIEVNPRVSRSSALASKATGYPIAKIAAKIAMGLTLDEIKNPITKVTYAGFEPALDYIVTKIPRFPFDKFKTANRKLGTQMKATGETMGLGRTVEESLLKAIRSLETGHYHIEHLKFQQFTNEGLLNKIALGDDERILAIAECLRRGISIEDIHLKTQIHPFFLKKIENIIKIENELKIKPTKEIIHKSKKYGFTNKKILELTNLKEEDLSKLNIKPVYKMVDTCAAEFMAYTPYYYSTYEDSCEVQISTKKKILILGSGPIRIGQGIEFDYSTVHATYAIRDSGYEAIILNNNPETVSTDFNISDRLYFEPLYIEDVMNVVEIEKPVGVIVQFGGQTALNLIHDLKKRGVKILGTSVESMDLTEDRKKFSSFLKELNITQPLGIAVSQKDDAIKSATQLGYPVMVRPSYVIGGASMQIIYDEKELNRYLETIEGVGESSPLLIDRYLIGVEIEVDAIGDGENTFIPGIMEHIEKAGVHSGDSMAVYPTQTLNEDTLKKIVETTKIIVKNLKVCGLINLQFVFHQNELFVLEVNPRASRTVPFLSKVTGLSMAQIAMKCILGKSLKEQGFTTDIAKPIDQDIYIKAPVFSFNKLTEVEIALGPEMKSTGEVMGRDHQFEKAFQKSLLAAGHKLPLHGTILITLADNTKDEAIQLLKRFYNLGFNFLATTGTAKLIEGLNLQVRKVEKIGKSHFDLIHEIKSGSVQLVINTISKGKDVESDGFKMRRAAVEQNILCLTSLDTAYALLNSIEMHSLGIKSL